MIRFRNAVTQFILATMMLFACGIVHAADIAINPTGPVYRITNQTLGWGITGGGGFNNNFFFSPISLSEYVCVYVYNNNTSSTHSYAAVIAMNENPLNTSPSDATWQNVSGGNFTGVLAAPSQPNGYGAYVSGAALVSIDLSQSTVQAGSPDTATVILVQTQTPCSNVKGMQSLSVGESQAYPPILMQSETLGNTYISSGAVTNPAGSLPSLIVVAGVQNGTNATLYYDRAIISCTAVCIVRITLSSLGTCATVATPVAMIQNSAASSTAISRQACTVDGVDTTVTTLNIAANTPYVIDLKGFIDIVGLATGIAIIPNSFTGVINCSLAWWEK